MQKNKFDIGAKQSIKYAGEYAKDLGSPCVDVEHFLLGIIKTNSSYASSLLVENNVTTVRIITYINLLGQRKIEISNLDLSFEATKVIENSLEIANFREINEQHLLLAILKSNSTRSLLKYLNVDVSTLELKLNDSLNVNFNVKSYRKSLDSKILNQYGKELVSLATIGTLDPVIGREKEIYDLICILSRRRKNNPAILGEAGVGKTALVEGLAHKIAKGEVPSNLLNKKIVSLDLSSIIAGTKYRGEFEDRVKNIADECIKHKDVILFIDEVHIIMGAGGAEGAIDAANILKPALSRGQIQIIGATTFEEYRKNIEKDAALERRFQKINVLEPSEEQTKQIIRGIRTNFELFHKVKISDDAISSAVTLSTRYFTDKKLPDKAIDLIDEACASFNIKNKLKMMKTEVSGEISPTDIKEIVSKYTGIDSFELDLNTKHAIDNLSECIFSKIIGQDDACIKIINAIKRAKVGINDPNRPLGSFIFLGPTGVGKTEICKAMAKGLFGSEQAIIKLDMSEYMDKTSVTKIIGASAGYVGYDDNTAITEQIRRNPYSIILFDEIEKAHPDILNLLLQILEDGTITDSKHRKINFKNSIVIMTSNIGANKLTGTALGFDKSVDTKIDATKELKKVFKPELINRIDEIVVFNKLTQEEILKITRNMLEILQKRVQNVGINIDFSEEIIEYISKKGFSEIYGARPIRRIITECIENPLTDKIINGEIKKGDFVGVNFINQVNFVKN